MEIKLRGEMTIADLRQALFEQLHELETNYSVKFSRGATLYINPTNGFGDDVVPRMAGGRPLTKLYSAGPYRSAADERRGRLLGKLPNPKLVIDYTGVGRPVFGLFTYAGISPTGRADHRGCGRDARRPHLRRAEANARQPVAGAAA
jgi:hypothetical protein